MKIYNTLFLFCLVILSQIFSVSATSLADVAIAEKREDHIPFEYLNSFIYFRRPENWSKSVNAYLYYFEKDSPEGFYNWPGIEMVLRNDGLYELPIFNLKFAYKQDLRVIFNDSNGNQMPGKGQKGFPCRMDAIYDVNGLIGYSKDKTNGVSFNGTPTVSQTFVARIIYRPKSNLFTGRDIFAHFKVGNDAWNGLPGEKLQPFYDGYYYTTIDFHDAQTIEICFTDSQQKNWDNNNKKNYRLNRDSNFVIDNFSS